MMTTEEYFLLTIFIIVFIRLAKRYIWDRRWLYYHSLRFRGLIGFPIIGSVALILEYKDIYYLLTRLSEQYQNIYKFWLCEKLVIVSSRPTDVEVVLKTCPEKDSHLYEHIEALVGNSLLTAEVIRWKKHRNMARPTLYKNRLQMYPEIFGRQTEDLIKILEENCGKGVVNIQYLLHRNSMKMAYETLLDTDFESEEQIFECSSYMNRITKLSMIRTFSGRLFGGLLWKLTPFAKEFDRKRTLLRNTVKEALLMKENKEVKKTSLLFYLNEMTKNDKTWNFEDKTDLCQTMLARGADTITSALCFITTALGIHKDVQEKVYQEQFNIFGGSEINPTTEDLNQMVYLEQMINETLRLFPPSPFYGRAITRDIQLDDNYTLPKGCLFLVSLPPIHRNPKFWHEPLKFDPDRFLEEEARKRPANIFLPFSMGPRNCIGIHYAMYAMKVVVSKLVRHFEMSSPIRSLEDIRIDLEIVARMKDGCPIVLEPRRR